MSPARTAAVVLAPALVLIAAYTLARDRGTAAPAAPASGAASARTPDFTAHWHDGRAEVDGYRYVVSRYGERREGQAVAIYVTEPFSTTRRVKAEGPGVDPRDVEQVLKLNLVRDFQTGIYDYNTMLSVFARTADLAPVKVSFASTEWCGNVYEELRVDRDAIRQEVRSYFDGESGDRRLARPAGGVLEDELFVALRGLRGQYLAPGAAREAPFLASAFFRRLAHRPAEWSRVRIVRLAAPERVTVPAGAFDAMVYVVTPADGREGRFWVESAYPHRIVKWEWRATGAAGARLGGLDGGALTGTERIEYWRLNATGGERHLRDLGLAPLPSPPAR
jgi:hypothetical protein